MSQAKVDKRKYEKIHRKEIERKRKIKTAVKCIVAALIIGAIVGVPTGIKIYKEQPKFVGDSTVEAFIGDYIDENYASSLELLKAEDSTESTESKDPEEAIKEAVEQLSDEKTGEESESTQEESDEDK